MGRASGRIRPLRSLRGKVDPTPRPLRLKIRSHKRNLPPQDPMKTAHPNARRRDPEFFHRLAALLISRRLISSRAFQHGATSRKCAALSGLLDKIAESMSDLPLKERLEFLRSSVEIVAAILAAMQREVSNRAGRSLVRRPLRG